MAITPVLATVINTATGKFNFTDSTDITGLSAANVEGVIKVEHAGQLFWQGTYGPSADIDFDVALTNNTINIPKDANGNYRTGVYTITYEVQVFAPDPPETQQTIYTIDYCKENPAPLLQWDIVCNRKPVITVTDMTPYTTNWTINSRTINLNPPPERNLSGYATVAASDRDIDTSTDAVWTGTWGAKLTAQIQRVYPTHTVICDVSYVESKQVSCLTACTINCCLQAKWKRIDSAKTREARCKEWDEFMKMISLASAIDIAEDCASTTYIQDQIAELKKIGNCTDCDDCGSTDVLIDPVATGGGASYTFTNDGNIIVTVAGSVVNIALSPGNAAILSAVFNTKLAVGSANLTLSLVVDATTTPDTWTYTLDVGPNVQTAGPPIWSGTLRIDFENAGLPTLSMRTNENRYDSTTTFKAIGSWSVTHIAGTTNQPAQVEVTDFLVAPTATDPFTVHIQALDGTVAGGEIICEVYDKVVGATPGDERIRFNLNHPWGFTYDWFSLLGVYGGVIDFSVTIHRKV